jgi:hypothetical protein
MTESAKLIGGSSANQRGLASRPFLSNQIAPSIPAKRLFRTVITIVYYNNYDNFSVPVPFLNFFLPYTTWLKLFEFTTVGPGNFVSTILGGQAPLLTAF